MLVPSRTFREESDEQYDLNAFLIQRAIVTVEVARPNARASAVTPSGMPDKEQQIVVLVVFAGIDAGSAKMKKYANMKGREFSEPFHHCNVG